MIHYLMRLMNRRKEVNDLPNPAKDNITIEAKEGVLSIINPNVSLLIFLQIKGPSHRLISLTFHLEFILSGSRIKMVCTLASFSKFNEIIEVMNQSLHERILLFLFLPAIFYGCHKESKNIDSSILVLE